MALDLFFEPSKQPLWTENLRWRVDSLFAHDDEAAKSLAFDYRNALSTARKCPLSRVELLPDLTLLNERCRSLRRKNVTVVAFK